MKSNRTRLIIIAAALPLAFAAFWLVSTSRAATGTVSYKVVRREDDVEIRDYPAFTIAGTSMAGGEMNGSFGRLFRYISGSNRRSEKIAMTTPVLIGSQSGEKSMRFILPENVAAQGAPAPSDGSVSLSKVQAGRFAVLRFSGARSADNEGNAVRKLEAWLRARNLAPKSAPIFAYYDPPWTPLFLRRNEVMIEIPVETVE
jgi:DNA gyrase inhibitor GyrI